MKVLVVGGSASNVGKTTLAHGLVRAASRHGRVAALKVSVREKACEMRVLLVAPGTAGHRKDAESYYEAGATWVVWVTVQRAAVRGGIASGLWAVRRLRADTLIIESTSAGIEMKSRIESYFIAGEGEWKPWAHRHRDRADHVLTSADAWTRARSTA